MKIVIFSIFFFVPALISADFKSPEKLVENFESSGKKASLLLIDGYTGKTLWAYRKEFLDRKFAAGSLIKPFLLLALEHSRKTLDSSPFFCSGFKDYEAADKICWLKPGHGKIKLAEALAHSCNSYFYHRVISKISFQDLIFILKSFHLSESFLKAPLSQEDFLKGGVGLKGVFQATPRQILYAYLALFNGGILLNEKGEVVRQIALSFQVLEDIHQGMRGAYLFGTASKARTLAPLEDAAAKTGTGGLSWRTTTGWAVFLWPAERPRYALLSLSEPGTGAEDASLLAGQALQWFLKRKKL